MFFIVKFKLIFNHPLQIAVVENIYKMIVDKILGYKSESIQEVKLSGRQEQDKPLATLLNDLLKVFSQQDGFDSEIIKRDKELILGMAVFGRANSILTTKTHLNFTKKCDFSYTIKNLCYNQI